METEVVITEADDAGLVGRLRQQAINRVGHFRSDAEVVTLEWKAASRIEAQAAEIERLTNEAMEAELVIDAFGVVTPQQYEKEIASLNKRWVEEGNARRAAEAKLASVRAEERERCARIAEFEVVNDWSENDALAQSIADKIRKSGE